METRSVPFELRASSDGRTLAGYAAVFNSPTRIFERNREFDEVIAPGAFARSINARDRVVLQFDHGQHPLIGGMPLGRITDMREDDHGLYVEARLSDHVLANIVATAIADEAITGMSFRFSVPEGGDTWDRSGTVDKRTVGEVKLYELGPVTFPAYDTTSVGMRSLETMFANRDTDSAEVADLVDQVEALIGQLVGLEAAELSAGGEVTDALSALVCALQALDAFEMADAGMSSDTEDMQMNSATPDEGSLRMNTVTPDEGSRSRSQRIALARLRGI